MIRPEEVEIIGDWVEVAGRVVGDNACERVHLLTQDYLEKIGFSQESGGWETLYRDPSDGRFWERTYLQSHMHGGGPPSLLNLTEGEARKKYSTSFD